MSETPLVPQPFLDWYDIWAGQANVNENNETWLKDPPIGVKLSVQQARRADIFFRSEKPWEQVRMVYPCVLLDNGLYRMWFWTWGEGEARARFNGYAESRDGFHWERPELGLVEYEGSSANNLLSRHDYFEINSVFADPNGAAAERYKAIGTKTVFYRDGKPDAEMDWDKFGELRAKTGHTGDPTVNAMKLVEEQFGVRRDNVVRGAVSADGLRWRVLDEPLVNVGNSVLDTQNVATYEPETGEYSAYLRGMFHKENEFGYGARRCVRKTAGKEFGNWSAPRYVLVADPQDHVSDDIYTSCYCPYPGVPGRAEFDSFTGGVLHDVGKLLNTIIYEDIFPLVLYEIERTKWQGGLLASEQAVVGDFQHPVTGGALLDQWEIFPELIEPIRNHHRIDSEAEGETALIALANCLTKGFSPFPRMINIPFQHRETHLKPIVDEELLSNPLPTLFQQITDAFEKNSEQLSVSQKERDTGEYSTANVEALVATALETSEQDSRMFIDAQVDQNPELLALGERYELPAERLVAVTLLLKNSVVDLVNGLFQSTRAKKPK